MPLRSLNLNKPYPLNLTVTQRWWNCVAFSLFVCIFLSVFQPFELNRLPGNVFIISLGYGLICFCIMTFLNVLVFKIFKIYFSEEKWTSKRELTWVLLNIVFIGTGNFLYSAFIGIANFTLLNLLVFETYTIAVGIFPVMATVIYNQARLSKKYEHSSKDINRSIAEFPHIKAHDSETITLFSEKGNEEFTIESGALLFVKAADNYVEIHYLDKGKAARKLIRNTMKNISGILVKDVFFRCHKSYIINLAQVEHFSGNAQGYKLHVKGSNETVPVSRSNNETIKMLVTNRP